MFITLQIKHFTYFYSSFQHYNDIFLCRHLSDWSCSFVRLAVCEECQCHKVRWHLYTNILFVFCFCFSMDTCPQFKKNGIWVLPNPMWWHVQISPRRSSFPAISGRLHHHILSQNLNTYNGIFCCWWKWTFYMNLVLQIPTHCKYTKPNWQLFI